jgi:hypothetical protein
MADDEGAKRLAFAEGTGRPIGVWEENIKKRRTALKLPGDPARPFQWSVQDFYVLAVMNLSDILFVTKRGSAPLEIRRWIEPSSGAAATGPKLDQKMFMMMWGPQLLLVTKGAKKYRFYSKELPLEVLEAMDRTHPMSDAQAKGSVGPMSEDEEEEEGAAGPVLEKLATQAPAPAAEAGPVLEKPATQAPPPPPPEPAAAAAAVLEKPATQAPPPPPPEPAAAAAVLEKPATQAPPPPPEPAAATQAAPELVVEDSPTILGQVAATAGGAASVVGDAATAVGGGIVSAAGGAATAVGDAAKTASESVVATVQSAAASLFNPLQAQTQAPTPE